MAGRIREHFEIAAMTADKSDVRSVQGQGTVYPVELRVLAVAFVLITLGLQMWPGASELLRFSRPAYEQGAFWQPLTSQGVHLSIWHAVGNAFAFVAVIFACAFWVRWPLQMLALAGGYIGVAAVVAVDPNCSYYAGVSGALHGMLAGNAAGMTCAANPPEPSAHLPGQAGKLAIKRWTRLLGTAILTGLAVKLWLQTGLAGEAPLTGWSFPVYHPSHVAGAVGGMGVVLFFLAVQALLAAKVKSEAGQ